MKPGHPSITFADFASRPAYSSMRLLPPPIIRGGQGCCAGVGVPLKPDQLMLSPLALEQVVLAKAAAHWITTGLPMTLVAPRHRNVSPSG